MKSPYIIGIGGGTASGKSTFATSLAAALQSYKIELIGMDRYFKQEKPVATGPLSGRQWPDYNQPESFHLAQLVQDLKTIDVDIVIIEGLMTLVDPELRQCCNLKLFVDAQADERIVRRLRRNMAQRGLSFDEIADYYLDSVRYRHEEFVEPSRWQADLVINGAKDTDIAIAAITAFIKEQLG